MRAIVPALSRVIARLDTNRGVGPRAGGPRHYYQEPLTSTLAASWLGGWGARHACPGHDGIVGPT